MQPSQLVSDRWCCLLQVIVNQFTLKKQYYDGVNWSFKMVSILTERIYLEWTAAVSRLHVNTWCLTDE